MPDKLKYIILLLICAFGQAALAQSQGNPNYPNNNPGYPGQQRRDTRDTASTKVYTADQQLDSLRKKIDKKKDTVVFSSKFIKVTNEKLLKDSTQLLPLDTGLYNFENYNPLSQPRSP